MLKLLQKEFILEPSRIQSERMGTVNHMKDLYDAARHLVSAGAVSFGGCLATQTIRPWRLGHLGWVRARHGGCHRQPAQFIKGN